MLLPILKPTQLNPVCHKATSLRWERPEKIVRRHSRKPGGRFFLVSSVRTKRVWRSRGQDYPEQIPLDLHCGNNWVNLCPKEHEHTFTQCNRVQMYNIDVPSRSRREPLSQKQDRLDIRKRKLKSGWVRDRARINLNVIKEIVICFVPWKRQSPWQLSWVILVTIRLFLWFP